MKGDKFDWTQGSGKTRSSKTGPPSDHTLSNNKGHYMFIETSAPQHPGYFAWLVSETFSPNPSNPRCISFWYFMYGATVDTLNVKLRVPGLPDYIIWQLKGQQGNKWVFAQAPILPNKKSYQIVFEGVRGATYTGDIAIDDIIFTQSSCGLLPATAIPPTQTTMVLTSPAPTAPAGPFNCTFDQNLCGWQQDKTDKFDWIRHKGTTGTGATGPQKDHTSGNGYYVYIETSTPRGNGDKARLISPSITPGSHCLRFWYNMFGNNVYYLKVYLMTGLSLPAPTWFKKGTQGSKWKQAVINIKNIKNTFNVVFEGIRGTGYHGDIAVDDVTMSNDECAERVNNGPITSCSFERSDICGFSQSSSDTFDWSRTSQGTLTKGTGPSADHTYGTTAGYYMYTESSYPRKSGDKAQLSSFQISAPKTSDSCVTFWYHMFGDHIGTLSAYIVKGGKRGNAVWSQKGDQGNQWNLASISVPKASGPYQIMFEGITGLGIRGDMALDDFNVSSVSCTIPGNCNFENGMCTWTNDKKSDQFDWTIGNGPTQTKGTGPTSDHTLNNSKGKYIYIEASNPRKNGDKARLLSEDLPRSTNTCLKFWYNMNGAQVGTLRVWVGLKSSNNPMPIWELQGNKGAKWLQGQIKIPPQTASYQVIFEGSRGTNWAGDIALDDITFDSTSSCNTIPQSSHPSVTQKPSTPIPKTTTAPKVTVKTTPKPPANKTDAFDWKRHKGPTTTYGTGPSGDHTNGRYYMYIEASAPRLVFEGMVGKGATGDVAIDDIMIEGTVGNSVYGDIALDDITFHYGSCSISPSKAVPPGRTTPKPTTTMSTTPRVFTSRQTLQQFCDFENATCGYTQDKSDDFDWTRGMGGTSSSGTGPTSDHTYGTNKGHYMYIETSRPRKQGNKARLFTNQRPALKATACFRFYYHMYGSHIGSLNLLLKTNNVLSNAIWTESGNHGAAWSLGMITLKSSQLTKPYQVVFEGVVGNGYLGDIAIDDISVVDGACADQGECDFEKDFCTWRNQQVGDNFDWIIGQGQTSSRTTGPITDHTVQSPKGHYVYIEASSPRKIYDKAVLLSSLYPPTKTRCLNFWYSMNGAQIGNLTVYLVASTGQNVSLWQLHGDQGDKWQNGHVPVVSPVNYRMAFEGERSTGIAGDIALDDVSFTESNCGATGKFDCDFDINLCTWTQDKTDQFDWLRNHGSTQTLGTGPTSDHSGKNGYYMYIETSTPRVKGDKARLVSPQVDGGTPRCLIFWFYMYGTHVDNLNVYIKTRPNLGKPVFNRQGTKGQKWHQVLVDVNVKTSYQVVIEASVGNGYRGDIAIDDVTLGDGACQAVANVNVSAGISCDFEDAKICGYTQSKADKFDWSRDNAGTSSVATGPTADHTYGTAAGHYMYIETSAPRKTGDNALLISSPHTVGATDECLEFWYHMYGRTTGNLNVYIQKGGNLGSFYWSESGNQGNLWKRAELKISAGVGNINIVFEAKMGAPYFSDIAIDDVSIKGGTCGQSGDCTFESNLCSWSNSQADDFDWVQGKGSTGSSGTGPATDHTTGTGKGIYMFIETSAPRSTGDTAILQSTDYSSSDVYYGFNCGFESGLCKWTQDKTTDTKRYDWSLRKGKTTSAGTGPVGDHTSGSYEIMLSVYLSNGTVVGSPIWMKSKSQGNSWKGAFVQISGGSLTATMTNVVFEAVRGTNYKGDIAIDDISMTPGSCLQGSQSPIDCTFEQFAKCHYVQDKRDTFDWSVGSQATSSTGTGPRTDHTLGTTSGHYMYIEASAPRKYGDIARLTTAPFLPSNGKCLTFWYHMHGNTMGDV
ncbi:MAM and LDL-receptor class A domain-containing protein 2 [Patella vulgata]|uniref:MAM and LDL-receptor class A domain-containing protein 2 n=1 Tax=Patella vulgata TaxID=6465 RepID=UPI0024A925FF|nr:MAM and LDL-receptor class A domain-containing protein 2 [Patella vulgata]